MERWKLSFEYEGTRFSGWQLQPDQRTVEGEVEKAFSTFCQTSIDVVGQGRTDSGVHARAQAAHADLPAGISPEKLLHAMKGLLPQDISLINAEKATPDFHARFHAKSRNYSYVVVGRKAPLKRHLSWNCGFDPDPELLNELAAVVAGEHDFVNFCIPPEAWPSTTDCAILKSVWVRDNECNVYTIEGNRFLRHMVRRLVGCMVYISAGRLSRDYLTKLLNGPELTQKAPSAPAHGLCLNQVNY